MVRISCLLAVAIYAAACTAAPPTASVTGSITVQSNGQPPADPDPFEDTLDAIDLVHIELTDVQSGKTVQTADAHSGAGAQFELDGLASGDYTLTASAVHVQSVTGDWETMGVTETSFTADGQPVDVGNMMLLYQPEY